MSATTPAQEELVERVAAIASGKWNAISNFASPNWGFASKEYRDDWRRIARAIIDALDAGSTDERLPDARAAVIEPDPEIVRQYARQMCDRFAFPPASWPQHAEFVRLIMRRALANRSALPKGPT